MDKKTASHVAKMKRAQHNVYGLPTALYRVLSSLMIASWVILLLEVFLRYLPLSARIAIYLSAVVLVILLLLLNGKPKHVQAPYSRQENFEFLGLHNLKEDGLAIRKDVLPRDEEIAFMHRILEETIFPQVNVKQALGITGPSGCGKSTILAFFRNTYQNEYTIYDFSGNYRDFYAHMASLFGTNIDQKLSEMAYHSKVVFILDQFERYFFLSNEEQDHVREMIRYLCRKNTAVIISLREEYLSSFLSQFDMNNLLAVKQATAVNPQGILKELINVIRVERIASTPRNGRTLVWDHERIKDNTKVHLDDAADRHQRNMVEKMGATLLYCQNQNETITQLGGECTQDPILEGKLRRLFGKQGIVLFRKHENEPLIEQQIIFHMAEFNHKLLACTDEALAEFTEQDSNELLSTYFDIQLSACPSYFHASRLLYLLSQARLHQMSIRTSDIEDCLFPGLFDKKGHAVLMQTIETLENLQLIRKNTEGSKLEYEIAHDFIASAFLNYCATGMNRGVKNALDLYIAEYIDQRNSNTDNPRIAHRHRVYGNRFYLVATIVTMVMMVLCYSVQRFILNPWTGPWRVVNPYGDYYPAFPLFITMLSVVYLWFMYDKVVKYYWGKKQKNCQLVYLVLMLLAVIASFAYPHFLFIDGIDLALAAINIATLLNHEYQQNCRTELISYGLKSCMIGLVFAAAHLMFFAFNTQYDDYMILTEFIMFTILVAYAVFAHMTQDFLFARMADASSDRI